MPKTLSHPSNTRLTLAIACLSAVMLCGCSTTRKTAEAAAEAAPSQPAKPASARGILAKGGTTASNRYIDPVISKASEPRLAQAPAANAPPPSDAFPPAPEQPASIAGLATQPTNVRAGSGSIFSAAPPAAAEPSGIAPASAELPRRNFNATAASVFSTRQAMPAAACGNSQQGTPISC
ncbi:hypothetical protein [Neorhizobium petrolearium]|uniref:hypothetical protein n=1 Tax=Neorhizobium petrolearium TaxID=515361 RepID=UPI003F17E2F4